VSDCHWWYLFHEGVRAETLQPSLKFDNYKPWPKSCIFKCISWLNGSFFFFFFRFDDQGFLREGVKTYLMAPMSPLNSQLFFCIHIYSLWRFPTLLGAKVILSGKFWRDSVRIFSSWHVVVSSPDLLTGCIKTIHSSLFFSKLVIEWPTLLCLFIFFFFRIQFLSEFSPPAFNKQGHVQNIRTPPQAQSINTFFFSEQTWGKNLNPLRFSKAYPA
jgi:hypothetical protein